MEQMTQKAFDAKMTELNNKQYAEIAPLKLKKLELFDEMARLRVEIQKLQDKITEHRTQVTRIDYQIKDINVGYHNLKHQFIIDHPKSETIQNE